jgi:hypothetical protein
MLAGNEDSGDRQQDEIDLNPSVLLGSRKRSKLQKYGISLQNKYNLSRTRQRQSPLPVENPLVQEDEEDDEVERDGTRLNPSNNPDLKSIDEIQQEVVVLDEEAKKRRLNTARWKAMMEEDKSDEEDEDEDEEDEDNHESSRQNNILAKVPVSNLPNSGMNGKNVVDQDNQEPPTSNVAEDHLRVKIKNKTGRKIVVKIRPKQSFKKLFAAWQRIAVNEVRLLF